MCAKLLEATDEELAERLSSGGSRFDSRVQWALTHLVQGGLLTRPRRGHVQITDRGEEVLAAEPDRVDIQLLSRFEEYREFRMRTRAGSGGQAADAVDSQGGGHDLLRYGVAKSSVDHRIGQMIDHFPGAMVTGHHFLIKSMTNHPKDCLMYMSPGALGRRADRPPRCTTWLGQC